MWVNRQLIGFRETLFFLALVEKKDKIYIHLTKEGSNWTLTSGPFGWSYRLY